MSERTVAASAAQAAPSASSARKTSRHTVPSIKPTLTRQSKPPWSFLQLAAYSVCTDAPR